MYTSLIYQHSRISFIYLISQIHRRWIVIILLSVFLSFNTTVYAAIELTFENIPETLESSKEMPIDVTLSGVHEDASYYLRCAFFKKDSNNYFGYTKNNENIWHNTVSEYEQFYTIVGNTTQAVSCKIDKDDSGYKGEGEYFFKLGRYTQGGSLSWSDQIETIDIFEAPTPTPSLTPTPTPTTTPISQNSPTPTLVPTLTPSNYIDPHNIELSEIYACPDSNEDEWVELYNDNAHEVQLTDWKLIDSVENSRSVHLMIPSHSYGSITWSSSMLNNSGDEVKLVNSQGKEIEIMNYESCEKYTSWSKVNNDWKKTQTVTKNKENVLSEVQSNEDEESDEEDENQDSDESGDESKNNDDSIKNEKTNAQTPKPKKIFNTQLPSTNIASSEGSILGITSETGNIDQNEIHIPEDTSSPLTFIASLIIGGGILLIPSIVFLYRWYERQEKSFP